jgi:hypothetical protein
LTTFLRFPREHWRRIRHTNLIERTFGESRRRVKVIGRLPGERSCLSLVWAVLDRASRGWRGVDMNPTNVRLLQQLRADLHHPHDTTLEQPNDVPETVPAVAEHHHQEPALRLPFPPALGRHRAVNVEIEDPNGCGTSTLHDCGGLLKPTTDDTIVDDTVVVGYSHSVGPCSRHWRCSRDSERHGTAMDRFVPTADTNAAQAASCGMRLAVENMHTLRGPTLRSVAELRAALTRMARPAGICFDIGHAVFNGFRDEHLVGEIASAAGSLISSHVHDSDRVGRDPHLLPGDGFVDWPVVLAAYQGMGYAGAYVVEVAGGDDPLLELSRARERLLAVMAAVRDGLSPESREGSGRRG